MQRKIKAWGHQQGGALPDWFFIPLSIPNFQWEAGSMNTSYPPAQWWYLRTRKDACSGLWFTGDNKGRYGVWMGVLNSGLGRFYKTRRGLERAVIRWAALERLGVNGRGED